MAKILRKLPTALSINFKYNPCNYSHVCVYIHSVNSLCTVPLAPLSLPLRSLVPFFVSTQWPLFLKLGILTSKNIYDIYILPVAVSSHNRTIRNTGIQRLNSYTFKGLELNDIAGNARLQLQNNKIDTLDGSPFAGQTVKFL